MQALYTLFRWYGLLQIGRISSRHEKRGRICLSYRAPMFIFTAAKHTHIINYKQ